MKKFLLNIVMFAAILLVGAIVGDCYVTYELRQNKSYIYDSWTGIYSDTTDYDLVINGSSRAWVQFSPSILDSILHLNTYNLGIDGSGINRQVVKYHAYCRQHKRPRYILQNIDLFTLQSRSGYGREQYFPYFFKDRQLVKDMDQYEHFSIFEKYLPYYRYIGADRHPITDHLYKGYQGMDWTWSGKKYMEQDTIHMDAELEMIQLLNDYLAEQTELGTQVLLVYSPMYHGVVDKCPDMDKMYKTFGSIAAKYDIPVLNYIEKPFCYDTTYFYNAMHLNRLGAELFTTQLANDIDSLELLNR